MDFWCNHRPFLFDVSEFGQQNQFIVEFLLSQLHNLPFQQYFEIFVWKGILVQLVSPRHPIRLLYKPKCAGRKKGVVNTSITLKLFHKSGILYVFLRQSLLTWQCFLRLFCGYRKSLSKLTFQFSSSIVSILLYLHIFITITQVSVIALCIYHFEQRYHTIVKLKTERIPLLGQFLRQLKVLFVFKFHNVAKLFSN